jgi:spore coat protein U-like protein
MHAQVLRSALALPALVLLAALGPAAQAATTVTGQLTASLTLTSSCLVNGASGASGLNFGALDFGPATSLFTEASGQVLGGGGGALSVLCSAGTVPVIKVRAGSHDGQAPGGSRALADGSGHFVPYDFYTDAGHNSPLAIDGTVALNTSTGVAQTVNLYGKAIGVAGLPAGTYTDTVAVELTF